MEIAKQNSLRISIRSAEGTEYAALLASLFGGGGHGGAAGAKVDLPGVTAKTLLGIKINGTDVSEPKAILKAMTENFKTQQAALNKGVPAVNPNRIEIVLDSQGKSVAGWMTDIVKEIRANQPAPPAQTQNRPKKR